MKIRQWPGVLFGRVTPDGLGGIRLRGALIGAAASVILPSAVFAAGLSRVQWAAITPDIAWRLAVQQVGWPVTDFVAMKAALTAAIDLPDPVWIAVFPLLCAALLAFFALWPAAGAAAAHLIAVAVRIRRVRRGWCAACSYPLAGQPRCAECGMRRASTAECTSKRRIRAAYLPLAIVTAINLVPLALYATFPRATAMVSSVRHLDGADPKRSDWFVSRSLNFGYGGLRKGLRRHPSMCQVTWFVPPEGPMATDVVVRFGWPAPWCVAGSERLPVRLLSFSGADPGWNVLLREIGAAPSDRPTLRDRTFPRRAATALLEHGRYRLHTHWPGLAGNLFFGAMLSVIALAMVVRAPVSCAAQPIAE